MTWKERATVSEDDGVYLCRQVYVWLVTKDAQVIIVSKDGMHWQLPGGKPEVGESLLETATREVYEETGLDIAALSRQINTFGYYVVKEPAATLTCYLQVRCFLSLPNAAADLTLRVDTENDEQPSQDVIRYVRCVHHAHLAHFIPWMSQSGEYQYLLNNHYLSLA